jgi:uncharacterized protein (TIGR02246 family)
MSDSEKTVFETAQRIITDRYAATVITGDTDGLMALWDDAATQMPPDSPMVKGKDAIREGFRSGFQRVVYERFDIRQEETRHDGQFGFALGNYTYTLSRRESGEKLTREGKYLTIYRQQSDGSWKIHVDCFNLNAPPK